MFDEGLNLLFAENGKGKSTFAAFLKAMLYGLPSNRKGGLENERRRYTPWQGGTFGGALCFEADGVEYRLERFFGAKEKDDRFALYHLATGNPSTKYGENIGEELFGVDADGFERSLYISQSAPHLPPDNNSIRARLGSLLDASEDLGSFEEADKLLDEARRHYRVQGERGLIPELSLAIREKEAEIAAAREAEATALAIAEERAAIEAKKAEMAKALDEVKTKRIGAEKRRLWDEQNAAYSSLVELKEGAKRQMVPFEEFFAPHLPTDEELFEADGAATECATLTAQYEHATLTAEDNAALEHFRAVYGESAPEGAYLERLRFSRDAWWRARELLRAAKAVAESEKDPLLLRFADHIPSEAEAAAIRAAAEATEEAGAALSAENAPRRMRPRTLFLTVGGALFAVLAITLFALSLFPLAIPAALLSAACFVLPIMGVIRGMRTPAELARRFEDYRVKQRRLSFLLSPFGYADKDPLLSAARFSADLERYRQLSADEARADAALKTAIEEETAARAALLAVLEDPACEDPDAAAAKIEADVPVYRLLLQKKDDLAARRTMLFAEREKAERRVQLFLSHYPSLASLSPRAALDTVKQNMLLSQQALTAYNTARNRVADYLQGTRFDPDAPPPPYFGDSRLLAEEEAALYRAYTELESLSSVKESERKRLHEIALTVPTLLAEKETLEREKAEAEHTLSLILLTKDILKDAKEDLSTRYLRHMELHFDRYYKKLTEGIMAELPADSTRASSFSMDTSLALSVEAYGERRPIAALSRGEHDLASFSARLSLIEAIFTKEPPFLLLDDPFINLDDAHYEKASALLSFLSERFQIVYTVCSTARLPATLPLKTLS